MCASPHCEQEHTLGLQVRDAVIAVLDAWASITSPDKPALALVDALYSGKSTPDGRITGLNWLASLAADGRCSAEGLQKGITTGAADRSAGVREAASALSTAMSQQVSNVVGQRGEPLSN